ncbi:MAG: hypothetical protein OXN18_15350 [Gemmatimonadota bacterium]|nr:hypothetical protein [Gemmatimonadota bacterium]
MIDSDTARATTRSAWMKDWGQFIVLLVALGGFYGFIQSDMNAMESRLGDRIDRNAEPIAQVRGEVAEVRGEVTHLREDVAHLEGYLRGRLGDDPGWPKTGGK